MRSLRAIRTRCWRYDASTFSVYVSFIAFILIDAYKIKFRRNRSPQIVAMTALRNEQLIAPASAAESELARASSRLLAACIGGGPTARLRVVDGDGEIEIPVSALRMLVDILANMAEGNAMSLVPIHARLTTQQAADFLGVSRPYLVGLIARGELPHEMVGTHRRVLFRDLMTYREARLKRSKAAFAELAEQAQELGFY